MNSFLVTLFLSLPFTMGVRQQTDQSPLVITGAKVVFFTPTQAERDSIVQQEGLEIDDIIDDYNLSSGKAAVYLGTLKVPVEYSSSRWIIFRLGKKSVRQFDRKVVPDVVGMILSDGVQVPRLIGGPREPQQLISEINEFFHIKE